MKKRYLLGLSLPLIIGVCAISPIKKITFADGPTFNDEEDRMLDDLTHETLLDTSLFDYVEAGGTYSYTNASYLSVKINNDNNTVNGAIYKCAPKKNNPGRDGGLAIRLRSPDESIKLEDLNLHYRGASDKDDDTLAVELDKAMDEYGMPLPEITSDWQTIFIHTANSVDDLDFISTYVGLHLVADDNVQGNLDIKYLYYADSQDKQWDDKDVYQIDDFEGRDKVSATSPHLQNTYWRFAKTGVIVSSALSLVDGYYAVASDSKGNGDGAHSNIVITAKGGEIDYISPIYGNKIDGYTVGTQYNWSDLKDNNGSSMQNIVSDGFNGYIINFKNSGITDNKLAGIKIYGKNTLIHNIFWSNTAPLIPATEYPRLNASSRRVYEDFNREEVGAETEYIPNTPIATQNDLYYILSYHNADRLSIENGALVFNGTGSVDDPINYKSSGCRVNNGAYEYVVFKMKGVDGANLDNFRFTTIDDNGNTTEVKYPSELYSDVKYPLPSLNDASYPYTTKDGWQYIIVDLKMSGFPKVLHGFDLYYSGAGKLYIDEIFYAGRSQTNPEYSDVLNELELLSDSVKPTVEYTLNETLVVGEKIVINPVVSDNLSSLENITVIVKVKHNGEYIQLEKDSSFVVEKGKYVIIILAIDEADNVNTFKLYREVK